MFYWCHPLLFFLLACFVRLLSAWAGTHPLRGFLRPLAKDAELYIVECALSTDLRARACAGTCAVIMQVFAQLSAMSYPGVRPLRSLLATTRSPLPRRLQFPIPLRMDRTPPTHEHVVRRHIPNRAVQADVAIAIGSSQKSRGTQPLCSLTHP